MNITWSKIIVELKIESPWLQYEPPRKHWYDRTATRVPSIARGAERLANNPHLAALHRPTKN